MKSGFRHVRQWLIAYLSQVSSFCKSVFVQLQCSAEMNGCQRALTGCVILIWALCYGWVKYLIPFYVLLICISISVIWCVCGVSHAFGHWKLNMLWTAFPMYTCMTKHRCALCGIIINSEAVLNVFTLEMWHNKVYLKKSVYIIKPHFPVCEVYLAVTLQSCSLIDECQSGSSTDYRVDATFPQQLIKALNWDCTDFGF